MSSLAEMMDYARAQQPPNTLADTAAHFLEGAGQGYDKGVEMALKRQENPMVSMNPDLAASLNLPSGQKVPLDVYSRILDAHAKMADNAANDAFNAQFQSKLITKNQADNAAVQGRAATLADIGTKALAAGQPDISGNTVATRTQSLVDTANGNPPAPAPSTPEAPTPKMTISSAGGKVTRSMTFERSDSKIVTPAQHDALINGDTKALGTAFPQGIPDWASKMVVERQARDAAAADRSQKAQEAKDAVSLERAYSDIEKRANPALAPRGSPLGMAAINNQRADRATAILTNPDATDQQLMAGTVDLAAIMHGGAPDEIEVKGQMYSTLRGKWNKLVTYVTSNPQAARQPEVQAKIRQMIADVKQVDNKTVKDNLASIEISRKWMVNKDPARWESYKNSILDTTTGFPGTTQGSTDFNSAGGDATPGAGWSYVGPVKK